VWRRRRIGAGIPVIAMSADWHRRRRPSAIDADFFLVKR
jgi:hypothetical protein